jgi:hypothetical protein
MGERMTGLCSPAMAVVAWLILGMMLLAVVIVLAIAVYMLVEMLREMRDD